MGKDSKIEWTHHTFNPWWGCEKIAPECALCYAATFDKRIGGAHWGAEAPRRFFGEAHWAEPVKWNQEAASAGERRQVFCASMADVFEKRPDLMEPRARLWQLIEATPHLDWLLLTKRPENIWVMVPSYWLVKPPKNVWYGTSAGTQATWNRNVSVLCNVPATVRFVSMEPLLESVNMGRLVHFKSGYSPPSFQTEELERLHVDWIIVGGESGHGARPMDPAALRSIRDQCQAAGVPFFFKQHGEWCAFKDIPDAAMGHPALEDCFNSKTTVTISEHSVHRIGKKRAGRMLDGFEWSEFPKVGV